MSPLKEITATILTIGDELLIGQVIDSNSAWIGAELTRRGITVVRKETVGDTHPEIVRSITRAIAESRIVVCTGGLGPTTDDLTVEAVAMAYDRPLEENPEVLESIRSRFARAGRRMADSNLRQARIPRGFTILENTVGTAPGLFVDQNGCMLFVLPGVPREMKAFVESDVLPRIASLTDVPSIQQKTLLTVGIAESELQDMLRDVDESISIAWLPSTSGVRIRIMARHPDHHEAQAILERSTRRIRTVINEYVYGEDDQTLEGILGDGLRSLGLTIAVAESCTAGLLASRITDVPGSSDYFLGGIVSYSNQAKVELLGVRTASLDEHGAVNRQVALEMATGVRESFGASIGLSVTGVMGPGGGSAEKPVGTVWVGFADQESSLAIQLKLGSDRTSNRERTVTAALNLLRKKMAPLLAHSAGSSP